MPLIKVIKQIITEVLLPISVRTCVFVCVLLPADSDVSERRALRCRAGFKIGHVEVGERVVDEAVHCARLTEHVLVDEPRDEV